MRLNVLYLEDEERDWEDIDIARQAPDGTDQAAIELNIIRLRAPEELKNALSAATDVVISDVYFPRPNSTSNRDPNIDRLDTVIQIVEDWSAQQSKQEHRPNRPLPIIAYTGYGEAALKACLDRKSHLFDIWDKYTATPEFVVWRLKTLANTLTRVRPDALLQRLIREMQTGARWHEYVRSMAALYDAGFTEEDQITRVAIPIQQIATKLGTGAECKDLWQIMQKWEMLSRAASRRIRGHARHVVNVFWLGYRVLHDSALRPAFEAAWRGLVHRRKDMQDVANPDASAVDLLSDIWFYTALFHDVGYCVEKGVKVAGVMNELLGKFDEVEEPHWNVVPKKKLAISKFFSDLAIDGALASKLTEQFRKSVDGGAPDHGVASAMHLKSVLAKKVSPAILREAARAIALHNLLPKASESISIDWATDPIAALLLFCDQLQTWDRERADETLLDSDWPARAELSGFEVTSDPVKPILQLQVNYIPPPHLQQSEHIKAGVVHLLKQTLLDNPIRTEALVNGWPFEMKFSFSLGGKPLDI